MNKYPKSINCRKHKPSSLLLYLEDETLVRLQLQYQHGQKTKKLLTKMFKFTMKSKNDLSVHIIIFYK